VSHDELKEYLKGRFGGYALFEPEWYDEGIVGITAGGSVVYSFEKLAEAIMEHDGMDYEDAVDWLCYNTIRTIPYMGEFKPVMLMDSGDCEDELALGVDDDGTPVYAHDRLPDGGADDDYIVMYPLVEGDGGEK